MMMLKTCTLFLLIILTIRELRCDTTKYEPNWESLNKRPLPQWYDEAKFGIFIHWGVYSVPSFSSEWFWNFWKSNDSSFVNFMNKNYPPDFTYQDFARDFTAEFFDPEEWAEIFQNSGAKYIVLTTKHHEGYTLWPSKTSFSWNAMDVGPNRDLVGELADAIKNKTNLKFGVYHSLFEWYNPIYLQDKSNSYTTRNFVLQKTAPELYELVEKYNPEIIWSDGSIEASDDYWRGAEFVAWLYNDSPVKETAVVNDRWGKGMNGKCGDFYTYSDRFNPGVLFEHKWENCDTIDKNSFGYRRNAKLSDFRTTFELLTILAETVSCGGNLLLNIGPTKDGIIIPIFQERLRDMGAWLKINGEAIYSSTPWSYQNDTKTPQIWYTKSGNNEVEPVVYAIVLNWPQGENLELAAPQLLENQSTITMLGYSDPLQWSFTSGEIIQITFPNRALVSSNWAWVLKMTYVQN
ncbi:hypothetical protein L9F63_015601 [Diploptera punctata]|uniref:Putative alpha-L-fucosidase n=1 Tax=Diploptera punctata TaxID=6984 RepID=A0AAD8EJQ1_DIPPU|nr:hypothetical protein L9F63_015601 [Diploptera punctata]